MVLDSWDEIESCILRRHPIRSIIDELRGKHAEIGHVAKEEEGERKEDDGMDDSPVESPPASSRIASLRPREHPRDAAASSVSYTRPSSLRCYDRSVRGSESRLDRHCRFRYCHHAADP